MCYDYETLKATLDHGVLTVIINNPPVNLMTVQLFADLADLTLKAGQDDGVKVVVFGSADPDFFIAHFDVETILGLISETPAVKAPNLSNFHQMCERVRTMPKATIVKMGGRTGGGGNEFAASCDMRFGVRGKTIINQMEVALGILPGGSGTQRLPRLVGRNRAMEICLGSDDIDAETLDKWGYLNRIFESNSDLDRFVDKLAKRIATWPAEAVGLCKASVNNAEPDWQAGLLEEAYLFDQTLRTPSAESNMRKAMEMGLQARAGELRMGEFCFEFAQAANVEE